MRNIFKNIAALGGVLVAVTGCGIDGVGDALSGGASMRIEIEVYKGPLSKEVDIQWGELTAIIREAQTSLATFDDDLLRVASTQGYLKKSKLPSYKIVQDIFKADAIDSMNAVQGGIQTLETLLKKLKDDVSEVEKYSTDSKVIELCKDYHKKIDTTLKKLDKTKSSFEILERSSQKVVKLVSEENHRLYEKLSILKEDTTSFLNHRADIKRHVNEIGELKDFPSLASDAFRENKLMDEIRKVKDELPKEPIVSSEEADSIRQPFNDLFMRNAYYHGSITVEPNNRGNIGQDRKNLPSRVVSHIHGDTVRMDATEFFWCNDDEFRYGVSGNSSNANVFKARIGQECLRLAQMHDEVSHLHKIIHAFRTNNNKLLNNFFSNSVEDLQGKSLTTSLRWASEIGSRMKTKAMYWASAMMVAPQDRVSRTMVTAFAALAAEYGNQIASRADTLLKQCSGGACNPDIRKSLPLSVYLREINPTEFHNLFSYNRSGDFASKEEMLTRPIWSLGTEETVDRARAVEKLFADHNWSQINTVYASGRGDVNMAFVKDEIGNWNLKNFSNDPSELLEGYKQITVAAMKAAAELAKEGSGSGGALDLVSRLAQGKVGSGGQNASGVDLSSLSRTMELQIQEIVERGKGYPDKKDFKTEDSAKVVGKVETVKQQLLDQLNDYQEMLEILEKSIVTAEDVQ